MRCVQVMFQMISSASETLVAANIKGNELVGVTERSLGSILRDHSPRELEFLQRSICSVLAELEQANISDQHPTELDFVDKRLVLRFCEDGDLLPKKDVIRELLRQAAAKNSHAQ